MITTKKMLRDIARLKKEKKMNRDNFYENHKKIEVPICFYIDDKGNKVYDFEAMTEEFEMELSNLDENVVVMCSVEEK